MLQSRQSIYDQIMQILIEQRAGLKYANAFMNREGEFLIFFNDDEANLRNKEQMEQIGEQLKQRIRSELAVNLIICVSNPVNSLLKAAQCYQEVNESVQYASLLGKDKIIFYENLSAVETFIRIDKIVKSVKDIIHSKYMYSITLQDIASNTFMSPNYLNSPLQKINGQKYK